MNKVTEWLDSKEPRERLILIAGAILLCLFLIYGLIMQPLASGLDKRERLLEQQRETLAWMNQSASEIKTLKRFSSNKPGTDSKQSLLSTVDRTAKAVLPREAIRRVEPQGNNQVQLWVEKAPFDPLLQWISTLQQRYAITVSSISIDRQEQGIVNARISLKN